MTVEQGRTQVERLYLDVLRWEAVSVDASDCLTVADLSRKIGQSLEALLTVDGHVPRAVRVTVTGARPRMASCRAPQLRAEVLNQIGIIGNERLWLEKVRLATSAADHQPGESEQLEALEDLKQIRPTPRAIRISSNCSSAT